MCHQTYCSWCPLPVWLHLGLPLCPPKCKQCPDCLCSQTVPAQNQNDFTYTSMENTKKHVWWYSFPTLSMKQNSELRLLESVPIWIVLKEREKGVINVWMFVLIIIGRLALTWCKARSHWCVCGRGRAGQSRSSVSSCLCGWWTSF